MPTTASSDPGSDRADDTAAVELAERRLGAGEPVIVTDVAQAWIAVAAEALTDRVLAQLRTWPAAPPVLALTRRRADFLHIPPSDDFLTLLTIGATQSADSLRGLADPTADLAHPLRGPLKRATIAVDEAPRAIVALCKAAHLLPAVVVARLGDPAGAAAWAAARELAVVEVAQLRRHGAARARGLRQVAAARVPLAGAEDCRLIGFRPLVGGKEHVAVIIGAPAPGEPVLTRLHSQCFTGDLLGSLRCDCGDQLRGAVSRLAAGGGGILLYLAQEGRDIGLINKLRAYRLQDQGFDTIEANERLGFEADERLFVAAAEMLHGLVHDRVRLLTNNPDKVAALERHGIEVCERVAHAFAPNNHNEAYLATKARRSGHYLDADGGGPHGGGPEDD